VASAAGATGTPTAAGIVILTCSRDQEIRVEAQRTAHGEALRECRRTRVRFPAAPQGKAQVRDILPGLGLLSSTLPRRWIDRYPLGQLAVPLGRRQSRSNTWCCRGEPANNETASYATSFAHDGARHQSTHEPQKEEPACASFVPPRNSRCDESTNRADDGDGDEQKHQLCRSERPHIATSGPSFALAACAIQPPFSSASMAAQSS
jgi:hypothetical protein